MFISVFSAVRPCAAPHCCRGEQKACPASNGPPLVYSYSIHIDHLRALRGCFFCGSQSVRDGGREERRTRDRRLPVIDTTRGWSVNVKSRSGSPGGPVLKYKYTTSPQPRRGQMEIDTNDTQSIRRQLENIQNPKKAATFFPTTNFATIIPRFGVLSSFQRVQWRFDHCGLLCPHRPDQSIQF
jgi:hypothetical protein